MASSNCIICDLELLADQSLKTFKAGGIKTLVQSSLRRKDGKHVYMKNLTEITVHNSCYTMYNRERSIASAEKSKQSTPSTSRQSSSGEQVFDFNQLCLFCGEDASDEFIKHQQKSRAEYRKYVSIVSNANIRINILNHAKERNDKLGKTVSARIVGVEDIVQVGARYHGTCYRNFFKPCSSGNFAGRPVQSEQYETVQFIIDYLLEHRSECQFSLCNILINYEHAVPQKRYLLRHLQEYFQSDIVFHESKKDIIISFVDAGGKILSDNWYRNHLTNVDEERQRIVKTAALIVLEDIRSQVYDTTHYPAPNYFLENVSNDVPKTLQIFFDTIIKKNKTQSENGKWDNRVNFYSHSLISSVRPRSFISPLLLGLSSMMHKKYGSKDLIESLSYLGLCSSYQETLLFEASILNDPEEYNYDNSFVQFVYDNADHNTNTIDGLNTFHSMGGIMCVTPSSSISSNKKIERLKRIPTTNYIGRFAYVDIKTFNRSSSAGLKNIVIENLNIVNNISNKIEISETDFIWNYAKKTNSQMVPSWSGFMEQCTKNRHYVKSQIVPLPFVNNPPSQYDTIFTVLLQADSKCKSIGQKHCFVTFDQPLYFKAREILSCTNCNDSDYNLSSVNVRLGGFHTVMSYVGAIGYIMEGSGLQELFCEIYAESSVPKIMNGHAYSRAVRGHFLIQSALIEYVLSTMNFTAEETDCLNNLLSKYYDGCEDFIGKISDEIKIISKKFSTRLDALKSNGPTAKLWIHYIEMIFILKQFIEAERSGNWKLHLDSLQQMIPIFHASGHFLYAKSAHLYLQDMLNLERKMDIYEYQKFTDLGYFTIRRSEKYWSGIWSDMTIEQVLMRSMKSAGGLTHGRGITQSVLAKWILSMLVLVEVSEAMENFCNTHSATSEQHVDLRSSRVSRDNNDRVKLLRFIETHNPFPESDFLMSITTGLKATENINCHEAFEIGRLGVESIIGKNFGEVKFQRKNRVLSLRAVNSSIKVGGNVVPIDPTLLFQRISLHIEKKEDMKNFLKFELAPFPLSIFNEGGMRKTQKSTFYENFLPLEDSVRLSLENVVHIIDGGFLLHRVLWRQDQSVNSILNQYVTFVKKYYSKNSVIIFDGYPDVSTNLYTKSAERARRITRQIGREVAFERSMNVTFSQETFLSNEKNKTRLVAMLREDFAAAGFRTLQAVEDADTSIVETAIEVANTDAVSMIVGEDIDLLVILTQLVPPNKTVYFLKPGKGQIHEKLYNNHSFKYPNLRHIVGFLHSFSGCDTTSAFYRQGKSKLIKLIDKSENLINLAQIFYDFNADNNMIAKAGEKIIRLLYKNTNEDMSLSALRYLLFKKSSIKSSIKLEALPPTEGASAQHSYRAHFQIQQWLGHSKEPTKWGWRATTAGLQPVYTTDDLIPQNLLEYISCKCTTGCNTMNCGCKKYGLRCSEICANCHGQSCSNIEQILTETDNFEEIFNDDITSEYDGINSENEGSLPLKRQRLC